MSGLRTVLEDNADLLTVAGRILLIVVLGVVVRWLTHRAIRRLLERAVSGVVPVVVRPLIGRRNVDPEDRTPLLTERRRQRAETIGSLLRSVTSLVVGAVALAMILSELGLDLAPVLASAGILGVALGFGAQNLVKDFLNGMFMIVEDQFGVGDAIDAGEASGIVEAVGLRVTRLRSVDGTVWHIRNGEILRIGNMSQNWSRALIDVQVAYETDTDLASAVIKRVADEVWHDDRVGHFVLDEPEVWGVEQLGVDGIAIRLVVKTAPLEQWKVARELRRCLKEAFDAEGIEIPFPQRSLWLRSTPDGAGAAVPLPDQSEEPEQPTPKQPDTLATPAPRVRPPASGEADVARADTGALVRPDLTEEQRR